MISIIGKYYIYVYNLKEKIAISTDYLLKQICKDVGFNYNSIISGSPL